jgi:hypothetical protein
MDIQRNSDLPATALGVLKQFEISITGIGVFSDQLIQSVKEGEVNPLELKAMIKALEMILERTDKETKENQMRAADLFPGDSFEAYGVKFTKADVYTVYDFKHCNDPIWNQRAFILESAKEQLKEREAFLKTLKDPLTFVDETGDSGEIVTILPPNKKSTPGLKLSIK